jgi:hypothetical protein
MHKGWLAWGAAFVMFASPLFAADNGLGSKLAGRFVLSYDEGLAGRYLIMDKVYGYAGIAYYLKGADTIGMQPVNYFAFKLGGEYIVYKWNKVNLSAFGEWREELAQKNSDGTVSIDESGTQAHKRYNQWNTIFRIGLRPELFVTDRLSFDYKLGIEMVHHSADFKVNGDKSGLESEKNSYTEFGVYEGRYSVLYSQQVAGYIPSMLLNIGFNIYF